MSAHDNYIKNQVALVEATFNTKLEGDDLTTLFELVRSIYNDGLDDRLYEASWNEDGAIELKKAKPKKKKKALKLDDFF